MSVEGMVMRKRELALLLRRAGRDYMVMRRNVRCRLCGRKVFVAEVPVGVDEVLAGFDGGLCACDVDFKAGDFTFLDDGAMMVAQEREA